MTVRHSKSNSASPKTTGSVARRAKTLAGEVRNYCQEHADPAKAGKYARYFTEGYDAWGLLDKDDPLFTSKQAQWLEEYKDIGLAGFLEAGKILFAGGKYEEGAVAIRFVAACKDAIDDEAASRLAEWYAAGIGNWAHNDVLCGVVLSPALADGRVHLDIFEAWRSSPLKYQRRAVPVAMLDLLKTKTPTGGLLDFIRPMMLDAERVVHQGLGWFLREAWKRDPKPVESFLLEWKDQAPRLIYQYATEKMTPEAKARFKKVTAKKK
jgi:3-methyladenine DNA glycosylase AlkD